MVKAKARLVHLESYPVLIVTLRCCRDWPIALHHRVGRCGYCGRQPQPIEEEEEK